MSSFVAQVFTELAGSLFSITIYSYIIFRSIVMGTELMFCFTL